MRNLSAFKYNKAHDYLKDCWIIKNKTNPAFTMRAWARHLGLKSNAPLSLMLRGHRPIPRRYFPLFIETLGLSTQEGLYLENLSLLNWAKDPMQVKFYYERVQGLMPKNAISPQVVDSFKYLENPLHICICEMVTLKGFDPTPSWIKNRLGFNASIPEIKDSLELLKNLNLIVEENGSLRRNYTNMTSDNDKTSAFVQMYHQNILKIAADQITRQPVEHREFQSHTVNINKGNIAKAKKLIRDFTQEFIREMEAPVDQGDATYQISTQFFNLLKEETNEKK